ncbi:CIA30 family protein [Nisaea nitritireducens]|uniref:CIA30 family protein n=1 Tax=Nisaea nitritireducens TaxID=568392 RepID=UPI0018662E52|nr:CIA30 family protein [Nisaea nitritireducens]
MASGSPVIDDLSHPHPQSPRGTHWQLVSDQVMGGVSAGEMTRETVDGRVALRMRGEVSLENNGGFLQLALDLNPDGAPMDASGWKGIELQVLGAGEAYNLHLRTEDMTRPWQSYRADFIANPDWHTVRLDFADFEAHRLEAPLDLSKLRRIGLVAIGRAFDADLAVSGGRFYA